MQLGYENNMTARMKFPPGYSFEAGTNGANQRGFSWGGETLDFVERRNLASLIDKRQAPFSTANTVARETQLAVFLCPSDPWSPNAFVFRNESTDEKYAAVSYVANWGPASGFPESPSNSSDDINFDATPDDGRGPFPFRELPCFHFWMDLDGSTHPIPDTMPLTVYRNLCSIAGGEVNVEFQVPSLPI